MQPPLRCPTLPVLPQIPHLLCVYAPQKRREGLSYVQRAKEAVGGAVAAVIGILAAPMLYASTALGPTLLIKGFEAVAVGGVGSIRGAMIAGCLLGVIEAIGGALLSPGYQNAVTFVVVLGILLLRPNGLVGSTSARAV